MTKERVEEIKEFGDPNIVAGQGWVSKDDIRKMAAELLKLRGKG